MLAYVARQPILNIKEETVGYELLFRDSHQNSFPAIDPDEATSKIITQNHLTLGLDQICQNKLAFINFHQDSLLHHFPTSLDKSTTVVEILETISLSNELVDACIALKRQGYQLALDDHNFDENWRVLYPHISIIKVDITNFDELDLELFAEYIKAEYPHITLLAERVETEEQFKYLKSCGYSLFQGYHFARPEILKQTAISADKTRLLNLIGLMAQPDVSFDDIAVVVEKDPTISFKLLRFISTAAMSTASQITTVKNAIAYLGLYEVRKFIALMAVANLSNETCDEIYNMALIRAKFCEYMEQKSNNIGDTSEAYLTGMLSLISVILKTSPEFIIPKLPISETMKQALLSAEGVLGGYIKVCESYETGDWDKVQTHSAQAQLSMDQTCEAYHQALQWQAENPVQLKP